MFGISKIGLWHWILTLLHLQFGKYLKEMIRPISILLLLFASYFLQAQNSFSSLYYSSRLKANTTSFLPILSEGELQNSFLGFTAAPLISYTQSFGESDFDYHSFGFSLAYKGNSKLSFLLDY